MLHALSRAAIAIIGAILSVYLSVAQAHTYVEGPPGSYPAYWTDWSGYPYHPYFYYLFTEEERAMLANLTHPDPYEIEKTICARRDASPVAHVPIKSFDRQAGFACDDGHYGGHVRRFAVCPIGEMVMDRRHGSHNDYFGQPPAFEPLKKPCDRCEQSNGTNPINTGSGNKHQRETDYRSPSVSVLSFERYYNSSASSFVARRTPAFTGYLLNYGPYDPSYTVVAAIDMPATPSVGSRWTHSYDTQLERMNSTNPPMVRVYRPDGAILRFRRVGGEWQPDRDIAATLEEDLSSGVWTFTENDVTDTFDAEGRLVSRTDRAGRQLVMAQDTEGRLASVTDDFGRRLVFSHRDDGLLESVTDPAGGVIGFRYDGIQLAGVNYPDGSKRDYHYNDKGQLAAIVDATGETIAAWEYDVAGRAISSEHAGGSDRVTVQYLSGNKRAISDERGVTRTYQYQLIHGVRRLVTVSGGACARCGAEARAFGYDSNGFLASRTDFNGNITKFTRDARGLALTRTEAFGTPQQRTITTEWHPDFRLPTRITEPGRITHYTYDANGNRLSETVTDTISGEVRATHWTYNAFGQVLAVDGPRTDVSDITTYSYDAQGNFAGVTNVLGHLTQYPSYDAHGNPLGRSAVGDDSG